MERKIRLLNEREKEERIHELQDGIDTDMMQLGLYNTYTIPAEAIESISHVPNDKGDGYDMIIDCKPEIIERTIKTQMKEKERLTRRINRAYDEILMLERKNDKLRERGYQVITLNREKLYN